MVVYERLPDQASTLLAKVISSLANSEEGYILFGIRSGKSGGYQVIGLDVTQHTKCEVAIEEALSQINPTTGLNVRKNILRLPRPDDIFETVLVIHVRSDGKEVYTFEKQSWQIEYKANRWEPSALKADQIFDLFRHKYHRFLRHTVITGAPPKISYASIEWPYTVYERDDLPRSLVNASNSYHLPGSSQARYRPEQQDYLPSKYDPVRQAIEWHEIPLQSAGNSSGFMGTLQLEVRNPDDLRLWQQDNMIRDLKVKVEMMLPAPSLSGLEVAYFDACGDKLKGQKWEEIVVRQNKLVLEMDLRAGDLFKKRDFTPYRRLEFDGVMPEPARYDDIREALQDCGLRVIEQSDDGRETIRNNLTRSSWWRATKRTRTGDFTILLVNINKWYGIDREISYGERTDKRSIPSGRMQIQIWGTLEGSNNQELTDLVNDLQLHLKERFKYVKEG